ncbi:hypothetical protein [Legionella sp. 16cNR16C]|uniref:hypothetical protein n=1 Tax=Legionella sp. 16cNR16C TaxID=2905656 RepID=UPI001E3F2B83|nr:hypothetical protein [Legionella sp. 16cNR16C]MCE3045529.1 hypothetical protein [Legionella sp. 16cNR16C]
MPKTILRVEKGLVLTSEMKQNLKSQLKLDSLDDLVIKEHEKTPDLKEIYQRRMDILAEAFEFIYQSITPSSCMPEELRKYLEFCKQSNQLPELGDQDKYQEVLASFTGMLVNSLIDNWNWPYRVRDAVSLLNRAEQYVIMQKGRNNLASLSKISQFREGFILNWENTLPACSKETIDDLAKIKKTYLSDLPKWLDTLPYYQQVFFLTSPEECQTATQLNSENNAIIAWWRKITDAKALSNADYLAIIDGSVKNQPKWFQAISENRRQLIRVLLISEGNSFERVEGKLHELGKSLRENFTKTTDEYIKTIRDLPSWFVYLPLAEQKLLKAALDKSERIEDVVHFLPSRLRSIPGLANLAEHNCAMLYADCSEKKKFTPRLRSSHLASRDVKTQPKPIGELHALRNFKRILEIIEQRYKKSVAFVQTLISPVIGASWVGVPDQYLDVMRKWVIANAPKDKFRVLTKNHALNMAKRLLYTAADDPNCLELLNAAKSVFPKTSALEKLIEAYQKTLESGPFTTNFRDYTGRELTLSSYEHLLADFINAASYGSCVSGKDRKALEIIHTDAMQIYYELYGEWPQFNEFGVKRDNFVDIVSDLYVDRHAHEFADENAPGTEGIKTPANYFPRDIALAIEEKMKPFENSLLCDDKNATNNEVKKIAAFKQAHPSQVSEGHKKGLIFNGLSKCIMAAQRLDNQQTVELLESIKILTGETAFWKDKRYVFGKSIPFWNKTSYVDAMPGGIDFMKKATSRQDDSTRILAEIYYILGSRSSDYRDKDTKEVYEAILKLRDAAPPGEKYSAAMKTLKEKRDLAFAKNAAIPLMDEAVGGADIAAQMN